MVPLLDAIRIDAKLLRGGVEHCIRHYDPPLDSPKSKRLVTERSLIGDLEATLAFRERNDAWRKLSHFSALGIFEDAISSE
jgi:hypothetical protein